MSAQHGKGSPVHKVAATELHHPTIEDPTVGSPLQRSRSPPGPRQRCSPGSHRGPPAHSGARQVPPPPAIHAQYTDTQLRAVRPRLVGSCPWLLPTAPAHGDCPRLVGYCPRLLPTATAHGSCPRLQYGLVALPRLGLDRVYTEDHAVLVRIRVRFRVPRPNQVYAEDHAVLPG